MSKSPASTAEVPKQLLDYHIRHQIDLGRYGNQVVQDVIGLLNEAEKEIIAKLIKRGTDERWTAEWLRSLLVELGQINYDAHVEAGKQLVKEMYGFADHEAKTTAELLQTQVPIMFSVLQPAAAQLSAIVDKEPITVGPDKKLLLEEIFQSLAKGKEERIRGAVRLGIVQGETIDQMVRRLRGTRAARYTDGILEVDRRGAAAMVRTICTHVSNQAVQKTYLENAEILSGWIFLATLDSKVSITCASLSGTEHPLGKGPIPPLHVNCRSSALGKPKTLRELGIDVDEVPLTTRASKDGPVRADISFDEWLQGQPVTVQRNILGATRQQLFADGKMPMSRFTNDKGVVYSLTQLEHRNREMFDQVFGPGYR
ncbi:MAG: hypothetical protein A2075_23385 [Geobacteraceae bacterium GWC2_58_44]|nr:MAG: hypothetical protein A2075_23385 [Geobacteraceae bacterium GWC2_58_44]